MWSNAAHTCDWEGEGEVQSKQIGNCSVGDKLDNEQGHQTQDTALRV